MIIKKILDKFRNIKRSQSCCCDYNPKIRCNNCRRGYHSGCGNDQMMMSVD